MNLTITDIIDILTLFQLLLLTVVLLVTPKGRRLSNFMLAVFLVAQSNCLMSSIVWRSYTWVYAHCPHLFYIHVSPLFLLGPCLYLFTLSMTSHDFTLKKRHLWFLLPAVLHGALFFIRFHRFDADTKRRILAGSGVLSQTGFRIVDTMFFLVLLFFGTLIIRQLIVYRRRIRAHYSSTATPGLFWLIVVDLCFIGLWLTDIADYFVHWWTGSQSFLVHLGHPIVFVLATMMVLKTLLQPEFIIFGEGVDPRSKKYLLTDKQKQTTLQKLLEIMKDKRPYLTPELTLRDLSELSDIHPRHLSIVINDLLNQNFYDFINRYRIEATLKLMSDRSREHWTILQILYEAGFNSKVAFNTAFKKHTGMTPKIYRRSLHMQTEN
ncbi:helix-turn-helix transcriptional regulator [bacterium]|nr:helix-turn-helix transcriptional regulator [bacterium]